MDEILAWMRQAQSDVRCAKYLAERPRMACHITAKTQQGVEKAIKAFLRVAQVEFAWDHAPLRYILDGLSQLSCYRRHSIWRRISKLFDSDTRRIVESLERLAPSGGAPRRNSEYPYQENGQWTAPCDPVVFGNVEIEEFLETAICVTSEIERFVNAVGLLPRNKR